MTSTSSSRTFGRPASRSSRARNRTRTASSRGSRTRTATRWSCGSRSSGTRRTRPAESRAAASARARRRWSACPRTRADRAADVVSPSPELRERHRVAAGLAHADLLRAVERGAAWEHDVGALERALDGVQVVDLDEQQRAAHGCVHERGHVLLHALARLVHQLDVALLQDHEAEAVAFRNLGDLLEPEPVDPERQARLDLLDVQHGRQLLHRQGLRFWYCTNPTACLPQLNATSSNIITAKPRMMAVVARSVWPACCASGISSSTTT